MSAIKIDFPNNKDILFLMFNYLKSETEFDYPIVTSLCEIFEINKNKAIASIV